MRNFASNLLTGPSMVTADSDFFLGGDSLQDKRCYFIGKQTGVTVAAADIVISWTIEIVPSRV